MASPRGTGRGLAVITLATLATIGCGRVGFDDVRAIDAGTEVGIDAGIVIDAAAPTIDAAPATYNRVFVTSTTHPVAALGSAEAADGICQETADAVRLDGTYVALLSSSTSNAYDRLGGARGWVRMDDLPVADTVADLRAGRIYHPVLLDEAGLDAGAPAVATGIRYDGTTQPTDACTDWTATAGFFIRGAINATAPDFATTTGAPCTAAAPFYCFGVDHTTPLVVTPAIGLRQAFVATPWVPAGGLAGADARCASDASAAGLTGTFVALLATTSASAASRLDLAGASWARVDGVALAPLPTDVMAGDLVAPLNLLADGTLPSTTGAFVWSGADTPDLVGAIGDTCTDWTGPAGSGVLGRPSRTSASWFSTGGNTTNCSQAVNFYCFED